MEHASWGGCVAYPYVVLILLVLWGLHRMGEKAAQRKRERDALERWSAAWATISTRTRRGGGG